MNRKGFTLIELLAVIIVLGLISTISIMSLSGTFSNSKKKTEELFVSNLEDVIGEYVTLKGSTLTFSSTSRTVNKCYIYNNDGTCNNSVTTNVFTSSFKLQDIINNTTLITSDDLINPANKITCSSDIVVNVYRDTDFVYCYQVSYSELSGCIDQKLEINNCSWGI